MKSREMSGTPATVLHSGGIDSTCCIHLLKSTGYDVRSLFVDFGQPAASIERTTVVKLTDLLSVPLSVVTCCSDAEFGVGELIGRNAFLAFAATLLGKCHDGMLVLGIHSGTPYYDCSPQFVERLSCLVEECSSGRLVVHAPFLNWSKAEVYDYFSQTGIDPSLTYSCEAGSSVPCGACRSCLDRVEMHAS